MLLVWTRRSCQVRRERRAEKSQKRSLLPFIRGQCCFWLLLACCFYLFLALMKIFINFSEVPPNATQDDIERVREGAYGQYMSRSRSTSFGEQPSLSGYGRKPPSLSSHNVATFPTKLHKILSDPRYQHIIRWLPHGRSWEVSSTLWKIRT